MTAEKIASSKALDLGFDKRWEKHPAPQATTAPIFWNKTGWTPRMLKGKRVLDVGCGCGRFAQIVADCGATVVGLDISPHALEASRRNVPSGTFIEHDLTQPYDNIKMPDGSSSGSPDGGLGMFDMVYSLGVLHHTSDPALSFANAAKVVKVGGPFAVWLYVQPCPTWLLPASEFLHAITKACPPEALYKACAKFSVEVRDMYKKHPETVWLQNVLQASGSMDDEECVSDTMDWHAPQYRFWHTVPEVSGWFEKAGFKVDRVGDFLVSVRGVRIK